jgi:Anaphase promoting complex subunit 8 / Cdc23
MVTVAWDPVSVCTDLQKSCQILSERCLKLSAKWAAEQWMGLPPDVIANAVSGMTNDPMNSSTGIDTTSGRCGITPGGHGGGGGGTSSSTKSTTTSSVRDELEWNYYSINKNNPGLHYARTLLELGEYSHSAAVLSQSSLTSKASTIIEQQWMPSPLPNLSPLGIYIRSYALYLAGERQKEESKLVIEKNCYNTSNSSNTSNTNNGTTQSSTTNNNGSNLASGNSSDPTSMSKYVIINPKKYFTCSSTLIFCLFVSESDNNKTSTHFF